MERNEAPKKKKGDGFQPKDLSANSVEWSHAKEEVSRASQIFTDVTFESMGLHPYLCSLLKSPLEKGGFDIQSATKVQKLTLPLLMPQSNSSNSNTGVLVKSQTGSGKTLTYLLPVMQELMSLNPAVQRSDGTLALIVAPTRELCNQIYDVLERLTKVYVRIVPGSISGGEKKKSEKNRLRKGVTVLVATPGRLLDHMKTTESFLLSKLRYLIVDEVDRLFDMGFDKTMQEIFGILQGHSGGDGAKTLVQRWQITTKRVAQPQLLRYIMVSATVSQVVQQHALDWMKRFILIDADFKGENRSGKGTTVGGGLISKVIASAADLDEALAGRFQNSSSTSSLTGASKPVATGEEKKKPSNAHSEDGVLVFDDDEDDTPAPLPPSAFPKYAGESNQSGQENSSLETLQQVPSTLRQFSLTVGMKWRLAALLALLRLHRGQKIVVFFATCDSVDYHALLLKHLTWPRDLGTDPSTLQPTSQLLNTYLSNRTHSKKPNSNKNSNNSSTLKNDTTGKEHLDPLEWRFASSLLSEAGSTTSSNSNPGFVYRLHGKVPQHIRRLVARDFARSKSGILLCTDVAARGLDLPAVQWIIQYDPPSDTADYVHRIGRTARRGNSGSAVLFLLPSEQLYTHLLSEHGLQLTPLSSQSMLQTAAKQIPFLNQKDKSFKNVDELCAVSLQRSAEGFVGKRALLTLCGIQAYRSFLRAYGTRSADCKGIFKIQDLHLGHCAKAFALHDKPSDFALHNASDSKTHGKKANNQDMNNPNAMLTTMLSEDIVGKVFNGDYASPAFKEKFRQAQLPAKSAAGSSSVDPSNTDREDENEDENESDDNDEVNENEADKDYLLHNNSKKRKRDAEVGILNVPLNNETTNKPTSTIMVKNSKRSQSGKQESSISFSSSSSMTVDDDESEEEKADDEEIQEERELDMKLKKQRKSGLAQEMAAAERRLVKRQLSFGQTKGKKQGGNKKSLRGMMQTKNNNRAGPKKGRNQLRTMSEFAA